MTVEERLEELYKEYEEDSREMRQAYDDLANDLIEKIQQRDEAVKLLRIAQPDKIANVRELISMHDKTIEKLENLLESRASLPAGRKKIYESMRKLITVTGCVEIRLLKRPVQNGSYRLEIINIPKFEDIKLM